ncbi:MAG: hypothetical protein PUB87_06240 [Eubacteriaceae bacterium]|nr:hypothetical protein [Eubacteriaceae bacterium]
MERIKKEVGVLLLSLAIIVTQVYFPGADVVVRAESSDVGSIQEDSVGGTDYDKYHVTFQVTGEDDVILNNAEITVQKSQNGEDFDDQAATSEKKYDLDIKQDENYLTYKFSVKADGYLNGEGSFSFDPEKENPYFDVSTAGQDITINVQLTPDPNRYHVEIRAVDENGSPIDDIVVNMKWSVDIYGSYVQEAVSPGVYDLQKKRSNGDWMYYQFTVSKTGYTSHDGSKFCFRTEWYNPYFNVKADKHFITITVTLTSLETALSRAKTEAIHNLNNYKNPEDYRQAEQNKLKELIEKWTEKINSAENVNSVNWNLEQAKMQIDALKTNIQYEDEEYRQRIYFLSDDGEKIYADEYGVVTITNVDSGNFYITRSDGSVYANNEVQASWRCVYEYEDLDHPGNIAFQVIVGTYGQYTGKFKGTYNATVYLSDLGRSIPFTVRIISGRIDKLRASVDGKDVSGLTIRVNGSEKKTAYIEGRLKGTERWISIPQHSLKYTAGGSTSVMPATGEFRTWGTSGSITYTLDADRSVSVTVNIRATIVKPTGIKVICPSKATVGDWNGAYDQYVGIMEGQDGYRVEVTPSNASNPAVIWEDLTPDVATFQSLHALGIVPKKAGTAKFKVSCVENPKISTTVSILFQYERPLKTAVAEKSVYYANTSDKTIDLKIITNGKADSSKGASEQRFYWSYSTAGVVRVTDAVHYDKTSVTIPNWFSHTISILGEGTVYVTGTPYDMTENCKPVTFKVVVTNANKDDLDRKEAERVEALILAIGQVTLDKKDQILYARAEFNALTSTQKGLVDDDIYAILVKAEQELRRLERGQAGGGTDDVDDGGGGSPEQGGNSDPSQDGGDDSSQEGETGGTGEGQEQYNTETGGESDADNNSPESTENSSQKKNNTKVTANDAADKADAKAPEALGKTGIGRLLYEVDIREIKEEIEKYVNELSPATKAAVTVVAIGAFLFGFMWRRRRHMNGN